jgi:hypothetical protein|nr:MAG TPA: hypothetical protein [Bacteriophage sp.]
MVFLILGLILMTISVISIGVMLRQYNDDLPYWIFAISCLAIVIIGVTFTFHGLSLVFTSA